MARIRGGILALGSGMFGLAYCNYRRDIRQARERVEGGSRIAATAGGPVEYGLEGEGPPVLVVHGAGGGYDHGLGLGQSLVKSGFLVIAMSRFGYLRTPLPGDASPSAQADAHAALLDALGVQRVAIVGVSAGAPSAMQFALRHPHRCSAMVLLVPAAYVPRPGGKPPMKAPVITELLLETALRSDFLYWCALRMAHPLVIRAILATPPAVVKNAPADEQARAGRILEHIMPVSARRPGLLNDAATVSSLQRYELERIEAPTLIMSTADDLFGTIGGALYTAEHIPHARFIGFPGGGHLWVGHQKEVFSRMIDFLKEHRSASNEN